MVYRGHDGVRQVWRDYRGDVFSRIELWETEVSSRDDLSHAEALEAAGPSQ